MIGPVRAWRRARWQLARRVDRVRWRWTGLRYDTTGAGIEVTQTGYYQVYTSMMLHRNGEPARQAETRSHLVYLEAGDVIEPGALLDMRVNRLTQRSAL